jgi:hypothetical protein
MSKSRPGNGAEGVNESGNGNGADVANGTARPLTYTEETARVAYEKAISDSLTSATSSAEKLLTAAFSIATAYGALIALVAPENETKSWILGLPFLPLMGAAIAAMVALTLGISADITNDIEKLTERIENSVKAKRIPSWIALGFMVVAVAIAAWVVVDRYGGGATPTGDTSVTIWVTPSQAKELASVCGTPTASISGLTAEDGLESTAPLLTLKPEAGSCGDHAQLVIPKARVVAVSSSA